MNDFTASNGVIVSAQPDGGVYIRDDCRADGSRAQALREFFQAEADERLGRWRVPGYPNWVCYPTPRAHDVVVFNEDEPECGTQTLSRGGDTWPYYRPAADAFFDAHPEPKPWTRAKDGESWYLTITSLGPETSIRWTAQGSPVRFWAGGLHISADSDEITDGRPVNVGMS